jgi:hypothetical protein
MPMRIFGMQEPGNIARVVRGEKIGTLVSPAEPSTTASASAKSRTTEQE